MHDPNLQSLRKAARVTVVATVCFTVGKYVIQDAQLTVLATFTAVALSGIADFGGSALGRTRANLAAIAAGLVLVPIGTWVSETTWTAAVAMFFVVLVVSFSGIYSGYFASGANAVILFYVVASGIPAPTTAIPARLEGLALAGALSVIAGVGLWPLYLRQDLRSRLGASIATVGQLLSALSLAKTVEPEELERRRTALHESLLDARTMQGVVAAARAAGPTAVDRAQMNLLHAIGRMDDLINRLIDDSVPDVHHFPAVLEAREALVATLVRTLEACARSLEGQGEPPQLDPVLAAKEKYRVVADQTLSRVLVGDEEHAHFAAKVERSLATRELATAVFMAAAHTRIAAGLEEVVSTEMAGPAALRPAEPHDRRAWSKWVRRARTNLTLDSVHLRNSLRLAAGLTVARVAVGVLDLQHGFWVVFATLTILKTTASTTRATAVEALEGTVIGFGAAAGLAIAFGGNGLAYASILPFVIFLAFYTGTVVNFVVGQACFTLLIVVLFNILQPLGWKVGLVRLEDVAAGAGIGVAVGLLAWPNGATGQLKATLAELLDAGRAYVTVTARALLPGVAGPRNVEGLRRLALQAAVRTEDVFAQYVGERRGSEVPLQSWAEIVVAGHRLWYSADVMSRVAVPEDTPCRCERFALSLDDCTTQLSAGYGEVATAIRSGTAADEFGLLVDAAHQLGPLASRCAQAMEGSSDPVELMSAVHLFELRAWIAELSDDLRRLDALVSSMAAPGPPEAAKVDRDRELPTGMRPARI